MNACSSPLIEFGESLAAFLLDSPDKPHAASSPHRAGGEAQNGMAQTGYGTVNENLMSILFP